jgi:hypothetical protein
MERPDDLELTGIHVSRLFRRMLRQSWPSASRTARASPLTRVALPSETDVEGVPHRALAPPQPTAIRIPSNAGLACRRAWSGRLLPRPPLSNRRGLTGPPLAGPAAHGNSSFCPVFSARAREDA